LSIACWADSVRTWQSIYAKKWAAEHPDVNLSIVLIPYANIEQKTLVEVAANDQQDVMFTQCKSLPKLAYNGAYLALDPYVNQTGSPITLSNYFPASIQNCTVNGKLYGLPYELNTGNEDVVFYNQDILEKVGATIPTDTWSFDEYIQTAQKANNPSQHIWGTDLFPQTYYDFDCYVRTYAGSLLGNQGKTFQLATDPTCLKVAQWFYDLRTKYQITPTRQASQNLSFPAGQVALSFGGIQSFAGLKPSIAGKFKWDVVLAPVAPDGRRGYEMFSSIWSISGKTKQPELAFNLLAYENSADVQTWSMANQGQPPTLVSVWEGKEAAAVSSIYMRIAQWLKDPKDQGPFPEPYNFQFAELEDKWENSGYSLWYGQTSFQSGLQTLQAACADVVNQPRQPAV
jgi:multiple sugar transport system substrate-binding protein